MNNSLAQTNSLKENYFSALAEYRKNNLQEALFILDRHPEHERFIEFKARILSETGNYNEAIKSYNKLAETNPSKSYYELARIYAEMGFEIESTHFLDKHFQHNNPVSMSEINMESAFFVINRTQEWREFWKIRRYNTIQEKIEEASYMINQNRPHEAINILINLKGGHYSHKIDYLFANAYIKYNDYGSALNHINEAIRRDRKNITYLELRRDIYIKTEEDRLALDDINTLIKLDEFNPGYPVIKAKLENNIKNYTAASETLEFYLKFFPDDEDALYYSAVVYSNMEQYSDALIKYNKLIELNPSKPEYFTERADIYFFFEEWNFALQDYSMALDINPRLPDVYYNLGWCRYKMNDKRKACYAWKHALRLKHNQAARTLFKYCKEL